MTLLGNASRQRILWRYWGTYGGNVFSEAIGERGMYFVTLFGHAFKELNNFVSYSKGDIRERIL